MYHICKETDKPDVGYMEAKIDSLMRRGIRLNDCAKLRDLYVELRETLKNDIREKYNILNPNSSVQITNFIQSLSSEIELESRNDIINICYDSETDKWTSNADALGKLADLGYEFARDLLDYRHVKKYAESIESIMSAADENGLIHPRVSLGKTNRINYSDPGILTIPKKLLWHLISPYTHGNILYSVDIKNQEPNILINLTGAKELIPALESEEGLYETLFKQCFIPSVTANVLIDTLPENRTYSVEELRQIGTISPALYSSVKPAINSIYYNNKRVVAVETVCVGSEKGVKPSLPDTVAIEVADGEVYEIGVTWESVDKKYKRGNDYTISGTLHGLDIRISKAERKEFKTAWLAISYGASMFGVKQACKIIDGKQVYNYITKINELKEYRARIDAMAKKGNSIICTAFGTPLNAGIYDDYKRLKRVLLDLPIQGTGADILSLLIKHFYEYCDSKNISDKLSLYYTRHDELIIEADKDWVNEVGTEFVEALLKDMLEHQINAWTPFKVEVSQAIAEELGADMGDGDDE